MCIKPWIATLRGLDGLRSISWIERNQRVRIKLWITTWIGSLVFDLFDRESPVGRNQSLDHNVDRIACVRSLGL